MTAIIGGIVIGLLSGASFQISGPTGAMSAILITIVAQYGLQGVFVASLAAGVVILLAGLFRLGKLVSFIPTSVVMGFTSGIAIIIALGQVDNFFGTTSEGASALEKLASYARLAFIRVAGHGGRLFVVLSCLLAEEVERKGARSLVFHHWSGCDAVCGFDRLPWWRYFPRALCARAPEASPPDPEMLKSLASPSFPSRHWMIESLLCGLPPPA